MAVRGVRRANPYGSRAFFGYDPDTQDPTEQQPYLGFSDVAQFDPNAPMPADDPTAEAPQLVQPIAPPEQAAAPTSGPDTGATQDDLPTASAIEARQRLAKALMGQQQEVHHPMQAIANAVSQITGAWEESRAQKEQKQVEAAHRKAMQDAMGDGSGDLMGVIKRMKASGDPEMVDKAMYMEFQLLVAREKHPARKQPWPMIKGDQTVYVDPDTGAEVPGYGGPRYRPRAAEGGGGGDGYAPTAMGANFALEDGTIVSAPFQKGRGFIYRDPATGEWKDIPAGARRMTESVGGGLNPNQFLKLKMERQQNVNALQALDKYFNTVGGLPQGMSRWANSLSANAKTFFGGQLSAEQFNQLDAQAQAQALLGMFRTTVVGPGVMTEYDAVRVLNALGKDPASALQNPQVIGPILQNLYQRKRAELEVQDQTYRQNAPYYGEDYSAPPVPDQVGTSDSATPPPPQAPAAPQPGTVMKGYKFKGGDPRDRNNWEKAQ